MQRLTYVGLPTGSKKEKERKKKEERMKEDIRKEKGKKKSDDAHFITCRHDALPMCHFLLPWGMSEGQ